MLQFVSSALRFAPSNRAISLFSLFSLWKSRRDLAGLDAHLRADLGLSQEDVDLETARPIWDVPQTWRL